jgi:3,4-dihydroxy-2-butanone 4-phosphate synthase
VELARLAGLKPAAVLCEITNEDGTMAKGNRIDEFAEEHEMVVLSIAELAAYRLSLESALHPAK